MGLDICPGGAQWAYSGFMRFRQRLAVAEGLILDEMDGFGGTTSWTFDSGQNRTTLAPLLNHSDCDGYLDSYECEEMIPRLTQIINEWDAAGTTDPFGDFDVQSGRKLINGMTHCAEHGCALVFS